MKSSLFSLCLVSVMAFGVDARGGLITITHGVTTVNIDVVTVGNPANPADTYSTYGRVDYTFRIGKYEVSENQWDAVVGADMQDLLDDPGHFAEGTRPVTHISWHEAAMFTNWLTSGDVTLGAYTIDPSGVVTGVDRVSALATYSTVFSLPTEDEWYKAAYYDPNKPDGTNYWNYATRQDVPNHPDGIDFVGDTEFEAVCSENNVNQGHPNDIDNAGLLSASGTMGQCGNVEEWTETFFDTNRRVRGGSWFTGVGAGHAHFPAVRPPTLEDDRLGFRVAVSTAVPEPSTVLLFAAGTCVGIGARVWKRRRRE